MYAFTAPDMASVVLLIVSLAVLFIFLGAIYSFFLAIFQFIFSNGEEAKHKKALNTIRYTILGIILCLMLLFLFPIVLRRLNVPGSELYTPDNIFRQVGNIISYVLNTGSSEIWVSPNNSEVLTPAYSQSL